MPLSSFRPKSIPFWFCLFAASSWPLFCGLAQETPPPPPSVQQAPPAQGDNSGAPALSPESIKQLVGPIALYPDALVSLILPASTVPSDVVLASRYLQQNGDPQQVPNQPWDPSVQSLAAYPDVLSWMDQNLSWTSSLGQAFLAQPADVMNAIQELRSQAKAAGNLVDTPQQKVVQEERVIRIVPAEPDYIYPPQYDPDVVFVQPYSQDVGPLITFGVGFAVGSWLNYDMDWGRHEVYRGDWQPGWHYDRHGHGNHYNDNQINVVNISDNTARVWHPSNRARQQLAQQQQNFNRNLAVQNTNGNAARPNRQVPRPSRTNFSNRTLQVPTTSQKAATTAAPAQNANAAVNAVPNATLPANAPGQPGKQHGKGNQPTNRPGNPPGTPPPTSNSLPPGQVPTPSQAPVVNPDGSVQAPNGKNGGKHNGQRPNATTAPQAQTSAQAPNATQPNAAPSVAQPTSPAPGTGNNQGGHNKHNNPAPNTATAPTTNTQSSSGHKPQQNKPMPSAVQATAPAVQSNPQPSKHNAPPKENKPSAPQPKPQASNPQPQQQHHQQQPKAQAQPQPKPQSQPKSEPKPQSQPKPQQSSGGKHDQPKAQPAPQPKPAAPPQNSGGGKKPDKKSDSDKKKDNN